MTERYQFCRVHDEANIRIVTLNRPEVRNALHNEASLELERIWNEFGARADLWVGIITGIGDKAFCAGNDLKVQAAGNRGQSPKSGFGGLTFRFDLDKPLIAAVNGTAMGGGFELALACDLLVASENAIFALSEPRVGLIARSGIHRLARAIPQKYALGMILTGRRVSADEAKSLGFVNEVVPVGQALSAAKRWAQLILECSPMAIKASKQAFYHGLEKTSLQQASTTIYPAQKANTESEDFIEGPKAFAEKRKPNWNNK